MSNTDCCCCFLWRHCSQVKGKVAGRLRLSIIRLSPENNDTKKMKIGYHDTQNYYLTKCIMHNNKLFKNSCFKKKNFSFPFFSGVFYIKWIQPFNNRVNRRPAVSLSDPSPSHSPFVIYHHISVRLNE